MLGIAGKFDRTGIAGMVAKFGICGMAGKFGRVNMLGVGDAAGEASALGAGDADGDGVGKAGARGADGPLDPCLSASCTIRTTPRAASTPRVTRNAARFVQSLRRTTTLLTPRARWQVPKQRPCPAPRSFQS